jgi:hypothetical protein
VRVSSEKQTLILAGEPVPRRGVSESAVRGFAYSISVMRRPVTIVATPVEDPMLIVQGGTEEVSLESAALPRNLVAAERMTDRGSAATAANAYARTQELSGSSARAAIIDTYA